MAQSSTQSVGERQALSESRRLVLAARQIRDALLLDRQNEESIREELSQIISQISWLTLSEGLTRKNQASRREQYIPFPIEDMPMWQAFNLQEGNLWNAKELKYLEDRPTYEALNPREKRLFKTIFGLFAPGDGMINRNLMLRFMLEAETPQELMFFNIQAYIETVHMESYGMAILSLLSETKEQEEVFSMVENLPCVKLKGDFIEKYLYSDRPKAERFLALAFAEGVFFVTLFAIIFFFKASGKLPNFIFMNEQISKDESLHSDVNAHLCKVYSQKYGTIPEERVKEIAQEVYQIEKAFVDYLLMEPIQSVEEDEKLGLTSANLALYIQNLIDQILLKSGYSILYGAQVELSWLRNMSLNRKTNFYEKLVGSYKHSSPGQIMDWCKKVGIKPESESSFGLKMQMQAREEGKKPLATEGQKTSSAVRRPEKISF